MPNSDPQNSNAQAPPVRKVTLLLPNPKVWWQRRPKAFTHPKARQQNMVLAIPAFLLMIAVQAFWIYQLTRPITPMPLVALPDLTEEPPEFEINLDPGPMGPASPNTADTSAADAESAPSSPEQTTSKTEETAKASPLPAQAIETPVPTQPAPTQELSTQDRAVIAAMMQQSQSAPAPQPVLAVEPLPSVSATEQPLLLSEDAAAESTTEFAAEEVGSPGGTLADAEARTAAVRPLAMEKVDAPEQIAAAPIVVLPGVAAPKIDAVAAADRMRFERETTTQARPTLEIDRSKPEVVAIEVPSAAINPIKPIRVKPELAKPELRVDTIKPETTKPQLPVVVAARPVLRTERAPVAPSRDVTPAVLPITPGVARINIATPALDPASEDAQARPVSASAQPSNATNRTPANANSAAPSSTSSDTNAQNPTIAAAVSANGSETDRAPSRTPIGANEGAGRNSDGLPTDPFASGSGGKDLFGQAASAAAAQVGDQAGTGERSNAFRRYHDPFTEDYPSRLSGLRMREPQLFTDVTRFLVKTFGAAALGFALKPNDEIQDFSGPDLGPLVEQWIQQHHGDLKLECKRNQETMDEHVRELLCGP